MRWKRKTIAFTIYTSSVSDALDSFPSRGSLSKIADREMFCFHRRNGRSKPLPYKIKPSLVINCRAGACSRRYGKDESFPYKVF